MTSILPFVLSAFAFAADPPADRPLLLLVVGADGAPEYGEAFRGWADRWRTAAERAGAACVTVGIEPAAEREDKRLLQEAIATGDPTGSAPLWLVLIGHGTYDGSNAKFNLRGPDVAADELAEWLKPLERPLVVIHCGSSSAPFLNRLSGPNRAVITATKSGFEMNFARFGETLSAAVGDPAADLDKDGQSSLLEVFLLASARVREFYEQEARLQTETALLDDNGDQRGTPASWFRGTRVVQRAKEGAEPDGPRAHRLHLVPSDEERRMPDEIRARRDALEQQIEELRRSKPAAEDEDAYYTRLEPLLIELARLYAGAETTAHP